MGQPRITAGKPAQVGINYSASDLLEEQKTKGCFRVLARLDRGHVRERPGRDGVCLPFTLVLVNFTSEGEAVRIAEDLARLNLMAMCRYPHARFLSPPLY